VGAQGGPGACSHKYKPHKNSLQRNPQPQRMYHMAFGNEAPRAAAHTTTETVAEFAAKAAAACIDCHAATRQRFVEPNNP